MKKRKTGPGKPVAARKAEQQSFYAGVLDEAEKIDFESAAGVEGIDDEIALIRMEIVKVIRTGGDAANLRLLVQATNALERLIRTRYQITREQRKGLREAIGNVLRDIAVPLGITIGTEYLGKKLG